ncbi:hypothetical protein [Streptomyces sp. AC154]|uniref:hypothetical protein n=1 Tax=Streptomyces sp. AC154 TaxID=3143184 RepID=UPI003F80E758
MTATTVTLTTTWSADRVWQLIGGFGSLPDWLPCIKESRLGEGICRDGLAALEKTLAA